LFLEAGPTLDAVEVRQGMDLVAGDLDTADLVEDLLAFYLAGHHPDDAANQPERDAAEMYVLLRLEAGFRKPALDLPAHLLHGGRARAAGEERREGQESGNKDDASLHGTPPFRKFELRFTPASCP
jgi:hypothetical protein